MSADMSGKEKAAILLLTLGEENGAAVWEMLDDDEIRTLSSTIAGLGTVPPQKVDTVIGEYVKLSTVLNVHGSHERARQLLQAILPDKRLGHILEEIGSPNGKTIWQRLGSVRDEVLASHLRFEHPQTIAVVLARLKPQQAARVLGAFDDETSVQVVERMLASEEISKQALEDVEESLRSKFMAAYSRNNRRPNHEVVADIFNALDPVREERMLGLLSWRNEFDAELVRRAMFTFDSLADLDPASAQTLMRKVDKADLAKALKGSSQKTRSFFLGLMGERARRIFTEEMEGLGPLRLKEVDEARQRILGQVRELEQRGEITIARGDDDMLVA